MVLESSRPPQAIKELYTPPPRAIKELYTPMSQYDLPDQYIGSDCNSLV